MSEFHNVIVDHGSNLLAQLKTGSLGRGCMLRLTMTMLSQQWGAYWQPFGYCVLETPVLSAQSGLREFLYCVYDVTLLIFKEQTFQI